jgi:hypothetical protein
VRAALAAAARAGVLPQVTVESLVRIDGRVAFIDATVRIDGLPADQGAVRLTLPPRCTLVRVREPASLIDADGDAFEGGDGARVIEVQMARNPDGVTLVELECERPVDPTGRVPFDPLGFAVEGVPGWRQRGRTALVVAGEWQLDWDDPGANRRVDPSFDHTRAGRRHTTQKRHRCYTVSSLLKRWSHAKHNNAFKNVVFWHEPCHANLFSARQACPG